MPPAITAAAPTTGMPATSVPGYGVEAPKAKAPTPMAASPAQLRTAPAAAGRRRSAGVATATSAPRASSQARVNGEKYAAAGRRTRLPADSTNDATMTTPSGRASRAAATRARAGRRR